MKTNSNVTLFSRVAAISNCRRYRYLKMPIIYSVNWHFAIFFSLFGTIYFFQVTKLIVYKVYQVILQFFRHLNVPKVWCQILGNSKKTNEIATFQDFWRYRNCRYFCSQYRDIDIEKWSIISIFDIDISRQLYLKRMDVNKTDCRNWNH